MRPYDAKIKEHYDAVAAADGDSSASTMADHTIRNKETDAISSFVSAIAADFDRRQKVLGNANSDKSPLLVVDVGCGNGFTLKTLQERLPRHKYVGVEQNASLRQIASTRANVLAGDIRDLSSIALDIGSVDAIICQRVIINIMDADDQRKALSNIIALARPGAAILFIETFVSSLERLNVARAEFGLGAIPPAVHNLPLPDDFFQSEWLSELDVEGYEIKPNALSSHFFVTRVLHEIALQATASPFVRNSHFVKFMSAALPEGVGDYSPLRFNAFRKIQQ